MQSNAAFEMSVAQECSSIVEDHLSFWGLAFGKRHFLA
jgi:hypothetical protein